jgi:hypothetical protein
MIRAIVFRRKVVRQGTDAVDQIPTACADNSTSAFSLMTIDYLQTPNRVKRFL